MEVSESLYKWLVEIDSLKHPPRIEQGRVQVSEQDTNRFENGIEFVGIIHRLNSQSPIATPLDTLESLKPDSSSLSKLHNWNILIEILGSFGVSLDSDLKALLVAGEHLALVSTLEKIKHIEKSFSSKPLKPRKKKKVNIDGALLLGNMNPNSELKETSSALEFLILSLCHSFGISPKQSAGLLTENGKYLEQLLTKGLKGDSVPVLYWYNSIIEHSKHLSFIVSKEPGSLILVLNSLKTGINSKYPPVAQAANMSLTAMHSSLLLRQDEMWDWFLGADVLPIAVNAYINAPLDLCDSTVKLFLAFGQKRMVQVFSELLFDYCESPGTFFSIISDFIRILDDYRDLLISQGLIVHWMEQAVHESADSPIHTRLPCIFFMLDLWGKFPFIIEDHEHLPNAVLTEVKRTFKEKSQLLKLAVLGKLFQLLALFYECKNVYTSIIYKTLAFILTENFFVGAIREFIFTNFLNLFEEVENMPIVPIIDATVKQLGAFKTSLNTFDFDFCVACARHPKLDLKQAVLMLDVLCKIFTNDLRFSHASAIPILIISGRFISMKPAQDFLARFLQTGFRLFYRNSEDYLRVSLLDLTEKLTKMGNSELNESLKNMLIQANTEGKNTIGMPLQGSRVILDALGDHRLELMSESSMSASTRMPVPIGRALSDINRVLQKRQQKEREVRSKSEQRYYNEIKQKQSLFRQINNRKIELGLEQKHAVVSYNRTKVNQDLIYDPSDETEHEQTLLYVVMKKFSRASKLLFSKYAKSGVLLRDDFEKARQMKDILTEGQAIKMLRDNNLSKSFISTEKAKLIYLSLIQKFKVKHLDYELFLNYLYQIACNTFQENISNNLSRYPSAISLQALFEMFSTSGVVPSHIYNEPDPGAGDREVVDRLNKEIASNPSLELPFGYKKTKENVIVASYEIPKEVEAPNSFKIALGVLDGILHTLFGFHMLEPTIEITSIPRVKATLNRPQVISDNGKHKGTYKVLPLPAYMNFTPHIKLGVNTLTGVYPNQLLLEVARTLDDLLHSVHNNSRNVISRNPKPPNQIENPVKIRKISEVAQQNAERALSEHKRQKRAESLKVELQRLRIEKEKRKLKEDQIKELQDRKLIFAELSRKRIKENEKKRTKAKIIEFKKMKASQNIEEKPAVKPNKKFFKNIKQKLKIFHIGKPSENLGEDINTVLKTYSKSLHVIFEVYAKTDNDPQFMSLKSFNKFLVDFNVIPSLINHYVMTRVFNSFNANTEGLSFDSFQQGIVRISDIGRNVIQKDLEKETSDDAERLKAFLEWTNIPQDPKETRNFVYTLNNTLTAINPRDKIRQKNQLLRQLSEQK